MPAATRIYRLARDLPPGAPVIAQLVRVWREAREGRLRFLTDLHTADEDRAYLSGMVLLDNELFVAEVDGRSPALSPSAAGG